MLHIWLKFHGRECALKSTSFRLGNSLGVSYKMSHPWWAPWPMSIMVHETCIHCSCATNTLDPIKYCNTNSTKHYDDQQANLKLKYHGPTQVMSMGMVEPIASVSKTQSFFKTSMISYPWACWIAFNNNLLDATIALTCWRLKDYKQMSPKGTCYFKTTIP
jgi:hypothetical protein